MPFGVVSWWFLFLLFCYQWASVQRCKTLSFSSSNDKKLDHAILNNRDIYSARVVVIVKPLRKFTRSSSLINSCCIRLVNLRSSILLSDSIFIALWKIWSLFVAQKNKIWLSTTSVQIFRWEKEFLWPFVKEWLNCLSKCFFFCEYFKLQTIYISLARWKIGSFLSLAINISFLII